MVDLDSYIPLPQDLMLATESNIAKRRSAFQAYLRVLKRSEEFALDPRNDAEMNRYQAKYAPQTVSDEAFLRVIAKEVRERNLRDQKKNWRWGSTDPKRLEAAQALLLGLKVIDRATPVPAMYTDDLLP